MADNNHTGDYDSIHDKLLGLGRRSLRKSYYPELQNRIEELENTQKELKRYKEHLEELVEARTTELKIVNEQLQQDIIERKQAEDKLRIQEEKYRALFNNAQVALFRTQISDGKPLAINKRYAEKAGYSNVEDCMAEFNAARSWANPGARETLLKVLHEKGSVNDYEAEIIRRDGTRIWISFSATIFPEQGALEGSVVDITARKRAEEEKQVLEERLQRAEKMEALGLLAGGVAHDLNNVIGIIVGYAELISNDINESNPMRQYLLNIIKGGDRAAAIVQGLLTMARRGVPDRKIINVNRIILDFNKSPEWEKIHTHNPLMQFKTDLEPDLLNISASSVHIQKTLYNLVSNASEAMPNGGLLTIKTSNQYMDKPVHGYDNIQEGDYVTLSVSDTGEGIREQDLKHIFEPFYTKKIMGRSGTGLGLAVVWGTIKDHNGYIDVQSKESEGTTFTLYFPATREEMTTDEKAISPLTYMGKGESILVVDDVKEQQELAMNMLVKLGYQVNTVTGGEEAIEYLKNKKADLIVLDMIMESGIDGMETYQRILEINPRQKAVIVSGFSETDRVTKTLEMGAGAFVRKPYILEKIGLVVRKELDRKLS